MKNVLIEIGDYLTFYDPEGKAISTETVEKIYVQYGRVNIACRRSPLDNRIGTVQVQTSTSTTRNEE